MAGSLPNVPNNFLVQPGNGLVYLQWDVSVGATSYNVLRSTDSVTYSTISSPTVTVYSDTTAVLGTLYYYQVQAVNANGTSNSSAAQSVTPVNVGIVSLGQVRLSAQQRADMVNSDFVTKQEWNSYINHSYTELYDMLVQTYGDEYFVSSTGITTDGRVSGQYSLPTNCYKLMGVDLGISPNSNGYISLKKFTFSARNQYLWGNAPVSGLGNIDLRYRMVGANIQFSPYPQANQTIKLWYVPRPSTLLSDSDTLDSVSGWDEYVVVDAAIKGMQKEESDVSVLMAQKEALRQRIVSAAANRDAGMPEKVTDVRGDGFYGGFDGGSWGGF